MKTSSLVIPGYLAQLLFATFAAATAAHVILGFVTPAVVAPPSEEVSVDLAAGLIALVTHSVAVLAACASMLALAFVLPAFFYRAYKNVVAYGDGHDTSPFWAAAMLWIPILGIRRVYRNTQEIYRRSAGPDEFAGSSSSEVMLWWFAWIGAGIAARFSDTLMWALMVASAVAGIRMVREIVARQERRNGAPAEEPTGELAAA